MNTQFSISAATRFVQGGWIGKGDRVWKRPRTLYRGVLSQNHKLYGLECEGYESPG